MIGKNIAAIKPAEEAVSATISSLYRQKKVAHTTGNPLMSHSTSAYVQTYNHAYGVLKTQKGRDYYLKTGKIMTELVKDNRSTVGKFKDSFGVSPFSAFKKAKTVFGYLT